MAEEVQGVVEPATPAVEAQPVVESNGVASSEPAKVDRKVYEKVREDMLAYKAEKKAKDETIAQLEARLSAVEAAKEEEVVEPVEEGDVRTKAKVDVLYLVQTDSFVKENLSLIEDKMASNRNLTVAQAVEKVKADFFDRMQKEVSQSLPEVPPKQVKPTGNSTTEDVIKDSLEGRNPNADPAQLEAYRQQLARLPK